jgi:hypothetical protein
MMRLFIYSKKLFLCYYFTEDNHDYNNDDTIILASAITLNEFTKRKRRL